MLSKITLALALAIAALVAAASYSDKLTAIGCLASGGGNLVPIW